MTNAEIILGEMALNNIDPDLRIDTYAGWKKNGYRVKKGEKAVFKTKIWKPSKKKKEEDEKEKDEEQNNRYMYLVNAAFFTEKQVEKMEVE